MDVNKIKTSRKRKLGSLKLLGNLFLCEYYFWSKIESKSNLKFSLFW